MLRAFVLLGLAACGRIGFDGVTGSDAIDPVPRCTQWGPFGAPQRLAALSTPYDDWHPALASDELELYVSHWDTSVGFGIGRYVRATPSGSFGGVQRLGVAPSDTWVLHPAISRDRQTLYVSYQDLSLGTSVMGRARRAGTDFAEASPITELVGVSEYDHAPFISADELRLYYSTRLPSSPGNLELAVAIRPDRESPFALPVQVPGLASPDNEEAIALSSDELEVVFVSDRAGTIGGQDLWRATRADRSAAFGAIEHLAQLSSENDESGLWLSPDDSTLYFNHDTDISGGRDADVFIATRSCLAR